MKRLLLLSIGLAGAIALQAQMTTPWTGNDPVDGTDYWLYNVSTGKWLQDNNSQDGFWTTHANVGPYGLNFGFVADGGYWVINAYYTNSGRLRGSDLYMDTNDDPKTLWELTPVKGLSYKAYNIDVKDGGSLGMTSAGNATTNIGDLGSDDGLVWQLVTKGDRLKYMTDNASLTKPVDATWLIGNFDLSNNNRRNSLWTEDANGNYDASDASQKNATRGRWNSTHFNLKQVLTNIPNGTYKFYVQGCYRDGDRNKVGAKFNTESEVLRAKAFANDDSVTIMSILKEAKTKSETGTFETLVDNTGYYVPDNIGNWSRTFAQYPDAYWNEPVTVQVVDNTMTIGIDKPGPTSSNGDWLIYNAFKLEYLGDNITIDVYQQKLAGLVATAEAFKGELTSAVQQQFSEALANAKAKETSNSKEDIVAAMKQLREALQLAQSITVNATNLKHLVTLCKQEGVKTEASEKVLAEATADDAIAKQLKAQRIMRRFAHIGAQENLFTGNAPEAGKSYYLYNVGSKAFFQGGVDFSTHMAVDQPGILVTLVAGEKAGEFVLDSNHPNADTEHYCGYNGYIDVGSQDAWKFVDKGNGIYNIVRADADTLMMGFNPNREDAYNQVDTDMKNGSNPNNQWVLVTKADRDALLNQATASKPVDASYLIQVPDFSLREDYVTAWNPAPIQSAETSIGRVGPKHIRDYVFEAWNIADPVSLAQIVSGLKPGYYEVSLNGYYRDGDFTHQVDTLKKTDGQFLAHYATLTLEGADKASTELFNVFDRPNTAPGEGTQSQFGEVPNWPQEAINFFEVDAYRKAAVVKVGADGKMNIYVDKMVEGEHQYGDWMVLDRFRMKYFGTERPTTAIKGVEDKATAAPAGRIYNLQGVEVQQATQPGIYIQNGRKFIVR